jgi:hypothetical protein
MHKVRILLHRQLVVQAVVHEDMCSENSGEPADAPLLTIQGMTACSTATIPVQKNVVLRIQGLGFDWPKQKKAPAGRRGCHGHSLEVRNTYT